MRIECREEQGGPVWYFSDGTGEYPFETERGALVCAELVLNLGMNPFERRVDEV